MVIAVITVWVMQVPINQIIGVITVWDRRVTTAGTMHVVLRVSAALVGRARGRVGI